MRHVVLVADRHSYRIGDYEEAAAALRVAVTVATDGATPLGSALTVPLDDPDRAAAVIAAAVPDAGAVLAVDDAGVLAAGRAAARLGLAHNPPAALAATRDKLALRRAGAAAGLPQPAFAPAGPGRVPAAAAEVGFPVVVKPRSLAAGRGVIRLDDPGAAPGVERRIRAVLDAAGCDPAEDLLVEAYVPGAELSVDGLLHDGELEVLAVFDKPEPMEGPFFEETLLVTPSRLPGQAAVVDLVAAAAAAVGLVTGPVHAEARLAPDGSPRLIEVAARTIGGLCGRSLTFGLIGESLETLVLRGALGLPGLAPVPARPAAGVLMLPIPATGRFTGVNGVERAAALPGITGVEITAASETRIEALPEGGRYLGFVFAAGADPAAVERSLRRAGAELTVTIDGEDIRPVLGR